MNRSLFNTICVAALTFGAAPLTAQETSNDDVFELGTIYIVGAKRPQDALSFPGTVAQADASELSGRGVQTVADLDRVFPGLAVDTRSSRVYSNFTLRGQSSLDYYSPSVQVYVDGLPQDPAVLAQMFPGALESAEVLYGPQGSLYGRGAVGGVINVTTLKPGEGDRFSYSLGGSEESYQAQLRGELQLAEGLWADFSLARNDAGDDLQVMGTGEDVGGTVEDRAQLRLRYAPEGSPLDITFSAARNEVESSEEQFVMGTALAARQAVPFPSKYSHDTNSFGLTVDYDLGWATFSSLTGYQDRFLDRTIFGSYTPEWQETLTQEFRLSSATGGPVEYVAGLFYSNSEFRREAYGSTTTQKTESYAAFGDLTWHATDRLDVVAGARWDFETTDATATGVVTMRGSDDWNAFSPKLGLSYSITPEWQAYGIVSSGFKAGGFTRTLTPANIAYTYDPATTWNGEAGLKYRSNNGTIEASVAAYYSVTEDYQMFVGTAPAQYLQNVGEVTAKGIDATLRINQGPWGLSGGATWGESRFTDYDSSATPGLSYQGNDVPYAPEFTARLAVDYTHELGAGRGRLIPRLGLSYQGDIWFDEANSIGQDGYWLVDAGLAWEMSNGAVLDLYATNLTDETYASYGFDASSYGLGDVYQLGRGREIGIRLTQRF
ncbi:pesticin/yersiniabactin receptor [Roseovarius pacificus]|uniref:Pesticin/yersiniabactin receptor n=1 Tax=Roseovarius pacificus TaxID=337701 RepID=A0A1M6ZPB7_9RHOB|nr:TonB-dependent receptor [Roseovarius pacificus]GGO54371.1 ligand-gated channel [Roseovarius pacificus]SHL32388.1 pesticin/yersiniabactin receptor [Roseovarius pacificus]